MREYALSTRRLNSLGRSALARSAVRRIVRRRARSAQGLLRLLLPGPAQRIASSVGGPAATPIRSSTRSASPAGQPNRRGNARRRHRASPIACGSATAASSRSSAQRRRPRRRPATRSARRARPRSSPAASIEHAAAPRRHALRRPENAFVYRDRSSPTALATARMRSALVTTQRRRRSDPAPRATSSPPIAASSPITASAARRKNAEFTPISPIPACRRSCASGSTDTKIAPRNCDSARSTARRRCTAFDDRQARSGSTDSRPPPHRARAPR